MKRRVTLEYQTGDAVRVIDEKHKHFGEVGEVGHARVYSGKDDPIVIEYQVIFAPKPGGYGNREHYISASQLEPVEKLTKD